MPIVEDEIVGYLAPENDDEIVGYLAPDNDDEIIGYLQEEEQATPAPSAPDFLTERQNLWDNAYDRAESLVSGATPMAANSDMAKGLAALAAPFFPGAGIAQSLPFDSINPKAALDYITSAARTANAASLLTESFPSDDERKLLEAELKAGTKQFQDARTTSLVDIGEDPRDTMMAGFQNSVAQQAEGLLTMENALLTTGIGAAGRAAQRIAAGGFTGYMGSHIPDAWAAVKAASTPKERVKAITDLAGIVLMFGAAAKHTVSRPTAGIPDSATPKEAAAILESRKGGVIRGDEFSDLALLRDNYEKGDPDAVAVVDAVRARAQAQAPLSTAAAESAVIRASEVPPPRPLNESALAEAAETGRIPENPYAAPEVPNPNILREQDGRPLPQAKPEVEIVDATLRDKDGNAIPEVAPVVEPPPFETRVKGQQIVEAPIANLKLSQDVPQFKGGANAEGIVEPLAGKFDRRGVGPIQVWERTNGDMEIISGRHRYDLAKRSGEETIPAQIYREADGFDVTQAAKLDAELNIRDGQGTVPDYANYFRNSKVTQQEAVAEGLLGRSKGQAGFSIANGASEDVFALHQSGKLTDSQARAISDAAPNNPAAQAIGTRAALDGKSAEYVGNLIKAARLRAESGPTSTTGDLFGFDDTAMREMDAQAKVAASKQRELREQIKAVEASAKRPEAARKLGVDVKDPQGVLKRVEELKAERDRWDNWPMHRDLVAVTRGEAIPVEAPPTLRPGEKGTGDLFQDADAPFNLAGEAAPDTVRIAAEKAAAEKSAAEAKAKQDAEQGDMFGAGSGSSVLLPNASSQPPVVPVKAISEIIRDLAKGFDIPIRFGRMTDRGLGGYFKSVADLIGSKKPNDIAIVSHEVGHKFDKLFNVSKEPSLRAELNTLGDPATPGSRSSWTKNKTLKYKYGEGIAEFIRLWMIDPTTARKMAPNMEAHFERVMDANPDLGAVLRSAQRDVQLWRNAPAEARLASSISVGSDPNKVRYNLTKLTRDLVDDLHIIRLASEEASKNQGKPLKPSEDPYTMARLLRGSFGMADTFIRHGTADFKTREVTMGKGLEQALKPVAGRIEDFRNWIVARRAQELQSQGRETGLTASDVNFVAQKYNADPAFQKAFKDVKEWNDSLLKYAVDAGYVTKEGAAAMRAMNEDYVPFHRVFEIGAGEKPATGNSGQGRGLNVGTASSLKRLQGSQRDIVDPLETMVRNAYTLITASEKAAINKALADLSKKPGMGKWVEEIATPKESVKVQMAKIRDQLEDAGADVRAVPDDLLLQFFRDSGKAPFGENIIKVTSDGQTKFYRLNSDLYESFHALDSANAELWMKYVSAPANLLRAGTTLTPDFALSNMMRDAFSSAVINRYGMLPFEGAVRGAAAMIGNPKLVSEWAAAGGHNAIEANFFDRQKLAKFMREKITKDLTPAEQAFAVAKSPLAVLRWLTGTLESATRIGEYQKAFDAAKKSGMTDGDARRQAAFEARDRQDFSKGGAQTSGLRQAAPFWNAQLQANVKFFSALKNRPMRTMLQGLAFVTVPKMIEQALNWNDEDYWDRPQWERDLFFLLPMGKDANGHTKFFRIPTPFEVGLIFGTVPGRFMQWAKTNHPKEAFDGLARTLAYQTIPKPVPPAAQVLFEANAGAQGFDMFKGREIVPDQVADLPTTLQWTEQTSLTARKIGAAMGMSPMKVDHVIRQTTGGLGKQLTHNVIDRAISGATGEERTVVNTAPGMRFFSSPAGVTSESVERFYKRLQELRGGYEAKKQRGVPFTENSKRLKLERVSRKISDIRKKIRATSDPDEKQRLYLRIADMARDAID